MLQTMKVTVGTQVDRPLYFRPGTSDELVIEEVLVNREYDLQRLRRLPELLAYARQRRAVTGERPLALDAGANIGTASILFAAMPDVTVVAVEPDPGNFEVLKRNVRGLDVVPLQAAISSAHGLAVMQDPGIGHWGFRAIRRTEPSPNAVPCVTVDDIYRQMTGRCFPWLVKIDIEGGEQDLFATNTEWVKRTPLIIVELHDWLITHSGNSRNFLSCVASLDRDFVVLGTNVYSIANPSFTDKV